MHSDAELLVILGGLHFVAVLLGGGLFLILRRSDGASHGTPDDEDDSGGGNDRNRDNPKTSPSGGIPLAFAEQAHQRLRCGHDKLADPGRRRVRQRTPAEPARRTRIT